jgi:hypothetical protein
MTGRGDPIHHSSGGRPGHHFGGVVRWPPRVAACRAVPTFRRQSVKPTDYRLLKRKLDHPEDVADRLRP